MTHIDSCFVLCQTVGAQREKKERNVSDAKTRAVLNDHCAHTVHDPRSFAEDGNKMLADLEATLKRQRKDPNIVWKASIMHHPFFGMHYVDQYAAVHDLLPELKDAKYDVFFAGHEHLMSYGYTPIEKKTEDKPQVAEAEWADRCYEDSELFPSDTRKKKSRTTQAKKGERLHQFVMGASGRQPYTICDSRLR